MPFNINVSRPSPPLGAGPDAAMPLRPERPESPPFPSPRALQTAEHAYKLGPDNAGVADTLGWILVEQDNTKRGIEVLQKAVSAAPNHPEIRYHLAQALVKAGDKANAIDHLERIVAPGAKFSQEAQARALLTQLKN